jgi:hypothetical protein
VIKPEAVSFISYPYEWCFSQLKDAALLTLEVQKKALNHGMSLKDASAYNVQFHHGKPILIDTLSFEIYQEGSPWVAYRQFCQHFLAPLSLMAYKDVRISQLLRVHLDGIPLDLTSHLLQYRTRLVWPLLLHIHLHSRSQSYFSDKPIPKERMSGGMSLQKLQGLVDGLEEGIKKLRWSPPKTEWAGYYQDDSYVSDAFEHKKKLVDDFLGRIKPKTVWDLGSNTGEFSRIASKRGIETVSFDIDSSCVELNYRRCVSSHETKVLPLVLDLTNPSPSIGWENNERMSLQERGPADAVLALALIHHLAIANNLPFSRIARFLHKMCSWLIIEFIPKKDPKVQVLLSTREDIFDDYAQLSFEKDFTEFFTIEASEKIKNSERLLYLMKSKTE